MRQGAVVVNPSKFRRLDHLKALLEQIFHDYGWAEPVWLETTVEDPGVGQAREALTKGVDLVCALGGDGTQRCVAQGLADSGMPLGILAAGTGNLLARNLKLPHHRFADGLRVALSGQDRKIDLSMVELDVHGDGVWSEPEVGLVMTGIGLDAEILAAADDTLKDRVGWLAYPAAGIRYIAHDRMEATIALDGAAAGPAEQMSSVLIGNCGLLTGGMHLMPDAVIDDGILDTAVLRPNGLLGWLPLIGQVAVGARGETRTIGRLRSSSIEVRCAEPAMVEIDGDVLRRAYAVRVTVDPLAATVRVPRPRRT
ncbi:diacylglycerol kinase family protein [Allobranchiibius sp. CTAmp26]|uniref:diacylglycerol/lipid kinase family protein n=1 Tax=Allobranchiibius sp. CTAmp26 TaxID=2815214 RepID=UPI001AA16424|nr:diacylglycerol kinase family protein [Allobranchiibius sp. CTAmp26]MBO1754876.1 diacylglycerol kinase family lipid kinase [Allobranchiibius sp. CTAmp26]